MKDPIARFSMTNLLCLWPALILMACFPGCSRPDLDRDETPSEGAVEQELIRMENDWLQAFFKNDGAFADRFLADDYLGTDEHGDLRDKAQEIAEIKAGAHLSTSGVLDNVKIRVYGDAAVATGRRIMKGLFQGKEYRSPYLWTDIFIKRGGRWQCVASHVSKAAGKIAPSAAIR